MLFDRDGGMKQPAWRFHSLGVVLGMGKVRDISRLAVEPSPQPDVRNKEYEILQLRSFTEDWFLLTCKE